MTVMQPGTLSKVGKLMRTITSALMVVENGNRPLTSGCAMKKDGHAMFMLPIEPDACQSQHNRDVEPSQESGQ